MGLPGFTAYGLGPSRDHLTLGSDLNCVLPIAAAGRKSSFFFFFLKHSAISLSSPHLGIRLLGG